MEVYLLGIEQETPASLDGLLAEFRGQVARLIHGEEPADLAASPQSA